MSRIQHNHTVWVIEQQRQNTTMEENQLPQQNQPREQREETPEQQQLEQIIPPPPRKKDPKTYQNRKRPHSIDLQLAHAAKILYTQWKIGDPDVISLTKMKETNSMGNQDLSCQICIPSKLFFDIPTLGLHMQIFHHIRMEGAPRSPPKILLPHLQHPLIDYQQLLQQPRSLSYYSNIFPPRKTVRSVDRTYSRHAQESSTVSDGLIKHAVSALDTTWTIIPDSSVENLQAASSTESFSGFSTPPLFNDYSVLNVDPGPVTISPQPSTSASASSTSASGQRLSLRDKFMQAKQSHDKHFQAMFLSSPRPTTSTSEFVCTCSLQRDGVHVCSNRRTPITRNRGVPKGSYKSGKFQLFQTDPNQQSDSK